MKKIIENHSLTYLILSIFFKLWIGNALASYFIEEKNDDIFQKTPFRKIVKQSQGDWKNPVGRIKGLTFGKEGRKKVRYSLESDKRLVKLMNEYRLDWTKIALCLSKEIKDTSVKNRFYYIKKRGWIFLDENKKWYLNHDYFKKNSSKKIFKNNRSTLYGNNNSSNDDNLKFKYNPENPLRHLEWLHRIINPKAPRVVG